MDSRATQQCNMCPYVYAVYWLPPASSGFLLARKRNWLAEKMLITCVMRNARTHKVQWSAPTVHSFTVPNPKCLTAIIVFDIWARSVMFEARFLLNFGGKYCILCSLSFCEIFVCCEFKFGVFLFAMLLNWRPHLNVENNYWCQAFRI